MYVFGKSGAQPTVYHDWDLHPALHDRHQQSVLPSPNSHSFKWAYNYTHIHAQTLHNTKFIGGTLAIHPKFCGDKEETARNQLTHTNNCVGNHACPPVLSNSCWPRRLLSLCTFRVPLRRIHHHPLWLMSSLQGLTLTGHESEAFRLKAEQERLVLK